MQCKVKYFQNGTYFGKEHKAVFEKKYEESDKKHL